MAKVTQVTKKLTLSNWDGIRYQVLTHCFTRSIKIADGELECLSLLAKTGITELHAFCELAAATTPEGLPAAEAGDSERKGSRIYASAQAARNAITRLEAKGLVVKSGKNKKTVNLHPEVTAVSQGNIFLNYQIMAVATEES